MKKDLSLIHMARAMALMPRFDEESTQLEIVATYMAPAAVLLQARKDSTVLDPIIAQAAELSAPEAAEILADFFSQLASYNTLLVASLPAGARAMLSLPQTQTPASESSDS